MCSCWRILLICTLTMFEGKGALILDDGCIGCVIGKQPPGGGGEGEAADHFPARISVAQAGWATGDMIVGGTL